MRKVLGALLIGLLTFQPLALAADQWAKSEPAGTEAAGTIDNLIRVNNEAIDRLFSNYRRGAVVVPATAATLTVLAGELSISNAAGSVVRLRKTTSSTAVSWADIDTGSEANSTQYYVYACADTDITGFTIKISASSTAPSGSTYYRKIGYFYNNSSGDIVDVGNVKEGDAPNAMKAVGTTDITTSSTSYTDMTDMSVNFISHGRPVKITFYAPTYADAQGAVVYVNPTIDGTNKIPAAFQQTQTSSYLHQIYAQWLEPTLAAGAHTIKMQWKTSSGTAGQTGATSGNRIMIVEEL